MIARIQKSLAEKDKGFTLIELLVVIIIIGILAAIAIPVFLNQRKKAVDTGIKSDIKALANEIESYYVDKQKYPAAGDVSAVTAKKVTITDGGEITVSDASTTLTYTPAAGSDPQSYTITGYNPKGTAKDASNFFKYDSASGGLLPDIQTS